MQTQMGQNWSMWVTRGLIAALFGVVALVSPFTTLASLVMLAAAFILVDGILAFFSMFRHRETDQVWWSSSIEAVIGVLVGLALLVWPGIALLTFVYMLAFWAIFTGALEMVSAFRLRRVMEREWTLALAGLASVLYGIVIMVMPGLGIIATSWMLGAYAIIFGALMVNTGINLRREHHKGKTGGMPTAKMV